MNNTTGPTDPFLQTPWKQVAVASFISILFLVWILASLAIHNRDYPPIRSKGIFLILLMLIGDTLGVIGMLYVTQILDQTGPLFSEGGYGCALIFWAPDMVTLMAVNVQNYRMYRLHYIVNRRLPIHTFWFWLPFLLSNTPYLLYTSLLISPSTTYVTPTPMDNPIQFGCAYTLPYVQQQWIGSLLAISDFAIIIFGLYVAVQLRRLSPSLNESKEMINIYLWIFLGCVLLTANVVSLYSDTAIGKLYNVIFEMILPLRLCAILARPVWNCYFNRDAYLKEWKAGLKVPKDYNEANIRFKPTRKNPKTGGQMPNEEMDLEVVARKGKEEEEEGGQASECARETQRFSDIQTEKY